MSIVLRKRPDATEADAHRGDAVVESQGKGRAGREGWQQVTLAQIKRRYTKIKRCGGVWHIWLDVNQQSFLFAFNGTKAEVEWWRDMLAIALRRMIEGGKA